MYMLRDIRDITTYLFQTKLKVMFTFLTKTVFQGPICVFIGIA